MIKTLITIFISLVCFLTFTGFVSAHSRGFPILKINDSLTKVYPIQSSSIEPYLGEDSDIAAENYLINQNLEFDFEASRSADMMEILSWEEEKLEKVTYIWDFGDGTGELITNSPKNTHTYTKMGSYIMQISADFSQTGMGDTQPQLVQTTLIHVLPSKDYKLPEPVIKINDQALLKNNLILGNSPPATSSGSEFDRLRARETSDLALDFNKRLSFDASSSKAESSKIVQYQWDLGQGEVSKNKTASIKYKLPQYFTTAVLRVKDENGFIAEAAVDLRNSGSNEPSGFSIDEFISPTVLIVLAQILLFGGVIIWYLKFKRKKIKEN